MAHFKINDINNSPDHSVEYTAEEIMEQKQLESFLQYLDQENEKLKHIKPISVIDLGADYF
ncbi:hypothetical protein SOX05_08545 [Pseudomonas putida]|nr:hypothetical protein [Pseudomonas putida]MDY4319309.1 hypothetical protein [Pseudomonas putida]MDY4352694.1 hypothetical protein [Pseudomonas putida]